MKKNVIVLVSSLMVVAVCGMALAASALVWGGIATVRIVDRGSPELVLPIPMAAVEAASLAVDLGTHLQEDVNAGEWGPLVSEILEVLDDCPDAVLVDVVDGSARVRVEKRRGSLRIVVEDDATDISIAVPTRSVQRTVRRLLS